MNAVPEPVVAAASPPRAEFSRTRLLYWSVRRELWENRSTWFAPLLVAGLMLGSFALGGRRLAEAARAIAMLHDADQADMLVKPLGLMAIPIILTASAVAFFYCLDALHGERRDRSILFWKSLPVSDFVTVLSKALVPLVVVPLVACLTAMLLQLVVVIAGSVVLQTGGLDGTMLWTGWPLLSVWGALIYGTAGLALWHAPVLGWVLLVSGWAKRSTFLWVALPPLALCLGERIAFDTNVGWSLLKDRLFGFAPHAFLHEQHGLAAPDPLALLGDPSLWTGLVVALVFFAATVWFRRYRQPI